MVALWSVKGGVGKTTAAVNLAHVAAAAGNRTLLWDLDPQGAASFALRVRPRLDGGARALARRGVGLERFLHPTDYPNLELLPADFSLRHLDLELDARKRPRRRLAVKLEPLGNRFDLALLDCPPSVSLLSEAVLEAADAVLVPVVPSTLSLRGLDQVRHLVRQLRPPPALLPFLSMLDRRKRLHRQLAAQAAAGDEVFLATAIPNAAVVERMGVERAPVTAAPRPGAAARAFVALWQELAPRIGLAAG